MSDVTVSAPAAPASTPAPSDQNRSQPPSEVLINQNPGSSPSPVTNRPPEAPAETKTPSRREAILAAYKRAEAGTVKPGERSSAVKPAEAKIGHNQPPEETPKIDLKKRPDPNSPVPDASAPARERGERGQFAPRAGGQNQANNLGNAGTPGQAGQPGQRLPPHAPFAEPVPRMAESAKRDWANTPETVRGDIHRMNHEMGKAAQYYRGVQEAFAPIAKYHQMAQQHGTTLEKALGNFVSIEDKLRQDPIAGLEQIVYNLGLTDPQTGQRLNLRDISYHVLSQSPEQLKVMQQGNVQQAAQQQIGALHQEVRGLKSTLQQWQTAQQFGQTRSAVDRFADQHPRFDELGALIASELRLGFDLDTAYRRAELLAPTTHAAQTRTTPAQTRPQDRSIHGSPDVTGSNPASRRQKDASPTPRAALQNAMARLNGGGVH